MNKRTVDRVIIADAESEKMHKMEAVNSTAGENWRDASKGGYFMYEMKVRKEMEQSCLLYTSYLIIFWPTMILIRVCVCIILP